MSIVGDRFVWYLDPIGAICIAMLILFSWVANAFEQVWLLVGKTAPREFISKLVYICITHDPQILKVDTVSFFFSFSSLRFSPLPLLLSLWTAPGNQQSDSQIHPQCRAYHAGQKYYVEVDVVMDAGAPLKITHDVSSDLQRKLEGLADVERAFVHVDYEHLHDIGVSDGCICCTHPPPSPGPRHYEVCAVQSCPNTYHRRSTSRCTSLARRDAA